MKERQDRVLRAALSSLICTLTTATAHAAGGGSLPHPLVLGLALVLGIVVCFGLGGPRITLARLVPAVSATQVLLHGAFTTTGSAMSASPARHSGHALSGSPVVLDAELMAGADHDGSMLLAHVVAGLITVCSLRAGTDALRRITRALGLRFDGALRRLVTIVTVLGEPAAAPRPRRAVLNARPRRLVALIDARVRGRRGPPLHAHAA